MKIRSFTLVLISALLLSACAKKEPAAADTSANAQSSAAPTKTEATAAAKTSAGTAAAPATPATGGGAAASNATAARVIEITGNDQMQFVMGSKRSGPGGGLVIEAKAGEQIKVVFKNVGTLPKEAMGHNWVLLKAGSDPMAFSNAAVAAKATDYIPPQLKDQVIAATKLLGPKQTDEVTFTVPAAGEYPFLCSFPAHFAVGMKGTLVAK